MTLTNDQVVDSSGAWWRLALSMVLATIGGIGLWAHVIVLPEIQAEFGVDRADASLPYSITMVMFAIGGVFMGRMFDRFGARIPVAVSAIFLGAGFILAGSAATYWQFVAAQAVFVGMLGSSSVFGPLVADISLWFLRHRGIAVAIVASGNYLAGTVWPPFLRMMIDSEGWRYAYTTTGIICVATMLPLAMLLRPSPTATDTASSASSVHQQKNVDVPPNLLLALLAFASVACCIAMAMPQVHIVAYCADLGYGPARGTQMLAIMLGLGIVSRLVAGVVSDRIGGVKTLIITSLCQGLALCLYLVDDSLNSLFVISALFGLSQGGIVPCYALIVRQYFPASQAGVRVSFVLMMSVVGMAIGGWMSGAIFDWTGSYEAAFLNGIAWNVVNLAIAAWLLMGRRMRQPRLAQHVA
jgi:MFS family permease